VTPVLQIYRIKTLAANNDEKRLIKGSYAASAQPASGYDGRPKVIVTVYSTRNNSFALRVSANEVLIARAITPITLLLLLY